MSDDEQKQDADDRTIRTNSKKRTVDSEALGGEREVPEDAEHVTMVPKHVPMQMRTDDGSDSDDE